MKLRYSFTFENDKSFIKEFDEPQDYLEYIRLNGYLITQMKKVDLIDEQTRYNGTFLNEEV